MSGPGPARAASLDAHVVVERPRFRLDIELDVAPGEVLALLGPNGAGKSTALRSLAGLLPLAGGRIVVEGRDITTVPTEQRPIGMVFQDYLLFAHMSALDNVAFGPRCHGADRRSARRTASELLERMGLADHAAARPAALSGGQAQRVALARALAVRPRLLLLDEPLAALDAHTRLSVRSQLRRHLNAFDGAAVVVTHDPLDAMVLADKVTVIEDGAVVQHGTPADVARHPRTEYIARLVGLNLYRGWAEGTEVVVQAAGAESGSRGASGAGGEGDGESGSGAGGGDVVGAGAGTPAGARVALHESRDGDVFVAFPPRAVALYRERPGGSPRNMWRVTIDGIERFGDQVRVHANGELSLSADITPAALAELRLAPGDEVWAGVKATEVDSYPV